MAPGKKAADAAARALFEEIGETLAGRGVSVGSMFGMPSMKAGGKAVAGLWEGSMVFKLPPSPREEALALKGAEPFDPMGGRPMKEWVVVPYSHRAKWSGFAEQALRYVAGR